MSQILTQALLGKAVDRLLTAPDDLILCGAAIDGSHVDQPGTVRHRQLFSNYLVALKYQVDRVAARWQESIEALTAKLGSVERARKELILEYPAGPAADMHFIAVVRHYWLACQTLNCEVRPSDRVDPPKLLLKWVMEANEDLCVEVLASQPYWPIGLTRDGRWC